MQCSAVAAAAGCMVHGRGGWLVEQSSRPSAPCMHATGGPRLHEHEHAPMGAAQGTGHASKARALPHVSARQGSHP